jgi:hypothetical protein
MRLCRCFLHTTGCSNRVFISISSHIYLEMVHKIVKYSNQRVDPFNIVSLCLSARFNLILVSATFGSLTSLSSLSVIAVVMQCILMSKIVATSQCTSSKAYTIQFFKAFIFGNAGNCTRLIELSIRHGLNLIYVLHRLVMSCLFCISGLMMKINPISLAGSNPIHYLLLVGSGQLYGLKRQHNYSLLNVVGRFGSIGILVHLSYE